MPDPNSPPDPLGEELLRAEMQRDIGFADALRRHIQEKTSPLRSRVAVDTVLGEYRLEAELGRGGMGVVYRAIRRDSVISTMYAIKVLKEDTLVPDAAEMFLREAQKLSGVSHQHVLFQHDARMDRGIVYLVLALATGGSLHKHTESKGGKPSEWKWVAELVRQVASGLRAVQGRHPGLVHRDVKPANIFLAWEDNSREYGFGFRAMVADFGLATLASHAIAEGGRRFGTWEYMAPEYMESLVALSMSADTYALGVVAYELATGQQPFSRVLGESFEAFSTRVRTEFVPTVRERNPAVPQRFSDLIGEMMSRSAVDRPPLDRIVTDLQALLVARQAPPNPAVPTAALASPADSPAPVPPRWRLRWAVGIGVTLVGLALAAWWFGLFGRSSPPLPTFVAGQVRDVSTHKPLPGVRVTAVDTDGTLHSATTDGDGRYRLDPVTCPPDEQVAVRAELEGYRPDASRQSLGTVNHTIDLFPSR